MRLLKAQNTNLRNIKGRGIKYSANQEIILDSNNALLVPRGDSVTRPSEPKEGHLRYNTDSGGFEFYSQTGWVKPSSYSDALSSITTGQNNVAMGDLSLQNLTTGSLNTAVGYNSGSELISGSNNILIGSNSQTSSDSVSDEITIGDSNINRLRIPGLLFDTNDASDKQGITWDGSSGKLVWTDLVSQEMVSSTSIAYSIFFN
jgi:hypothetical protein